MAGAAPLLTDSGLETWLVFHRGVDLSDFAAFPLLDEPEGRELLAEYYREHVHIAADAGTDIVLETPTWRASPDWGDRLGYDESSLDRINRDSVHFLRDIAAEVPGTDVVVSGCVGPRGDGYNPSSLLTPAEAEEYHRRQVASFAAAAADRVAMLTATHAGEAIGVVRAAASAGMPVVISFTVETDGRLPDGRPLHDAIAEVDAATDGSAEHFGINCAHPDHFGDAIGVDAVAVRRIEMVRANASRASHAELDEAEELDDGDPVELGRQYAALRRMHPQLRVLGGCCGTDARHIREIARQLR